MKIQNNDTKDEGLKGNEKIEEAISALQQEASQELLAHTLTVIRRRMKEEGQLILAVEPSVAEELKMMFFTPWFLISSQRIRVPVILL